MRTRRHRLLNLVVALLPLLAFGLLPGRVPPAVATGRVTLLHSLPPVLQKGHFRPLGRYSPNASLDLVIALKPPHPVEEQQYLHDVQTRGTAIFHHFLTQRQWNARFAPSALDEQAVVDWARSQGFTITDRYKNHQIVGVRATVRTVEQALNIHINAYRHLKTSFYSNDRDPQIPASLAGIVEAVVGLDNAAESRPAHGSQSLRQRTAHRLRPSQQPASLRSSHHPSTSGKHGLRPHFINNAIDVQNLWSSFGYDFKALYNLGHCCNPAGAGGGSPKETSIAIVTACDILNSDANAFAAQFGMALNISRINVSGGPSTNTNCAVNVNSGLETTMDVEAAAAMANSFGSYLDTAHIYVYEAPSATSTAGAGATIFPADEIKGFQQALNDNTARSASISWGGTESGWTASGKNAFHAVFDSMVGQGWNISVEAGDLGAYEDGQTLSIQYPESDPDVVSAGGTSLSLQNPGGQYQSEVAWNDSSGAGDGGCSTLWNAPSYQTDPSFSNGCGGKRSVPDISLQAAKEAVYYNGGWGSFFGTSDVAPELAGFFAQANAYLMSLGYICGAGGNAACAPMGNPNYVIYDQGIRGTNAAPHNPFYDITSGCNKGNGGTGGTGAGYCAGKGYDLATGWGSFNALQLAWAINWHFVNNDNYGPQIFASGSNAPPGLYINNDPTLTFFAGDVIQGTDNVASGLAGYSAKWDADPGDPRSAPSPGALNSFYTGPATVDPQGNVIVHLSSAGGGCHRLFIRAWDNMGLSTRYISPTYCYATLTSKIRSDSVNFSAFANALTVYAEPDAPGCATNPVFCVQSMNVRMNINPNGTADGDWVPLGQMQIQTDQTHQTTFGTLQLSPGQFPEGNHLLVIEPCDGNSTCDTYPSPDTQFNYLIDRTPPTTSASVAGRLVTGNQCGTFDAFVPSCYTSPATVTLSATDNVTGVSSTVYKLDGGGFLPYRGPIAINTVGSHTLTYYSTDAAGNVESQQQLSVSIPVIDTTAPTTTLSTSPALSATNHVLGPAQVTLSATDPDDTVAATYYAVDNPACSYAALAQCTQYTGPFTVSAAGAHTVSYFSVDSYGNVEEIKTQAISIDYYAFQGFFSPVDNPPIMNAVKAGQAVPIKFSLGGNQGLSILAAGSPSLQQVSCSTSATLNTVATTTAGSSTLSYDSSSGQYTYVWKTSSTWAGTCGVLHVTLMDGTDHTANFQFK